MYDEFSSIDVQNIRINNQNVLAKPNSIYNLFHILNKRSLINPSSISTSNSNRTIVF